MNYKEIGETGIKIPAIIFGTSALGNLYTALDENVKLSIVRNCISQMPSKPVVFDSAGKYGAGLALEMLGKCLRKLNIRTEDVIISNKLGWIQTPLVTPEPTFEKGVWHNLKYDAVQNISYKGIMKCWDQGNNLLGEMYKPQMLSVHDPDEYMANTTDENIRKKRFQDILDAYKALTEIKNLKKNITLGIGAKNWQIIKQVCSNIDLDWVMFANSFTIHSHPKELIDFMFELNKKNVTIINSAVFHSGFLVGGKYFDYRFIDQNDSQNADLLTWRKSFLKLCEINNVSPSHVCIRFGMSHPCIASIALNTSNPARVEKNIKEIQADVPAEFFYAMKRKGLIDPDYPFV